MRWISESLDILRAKGIPASYDGIKRNIMRESTGNPRAINDWDINAVNGVPSKGLLQMIDPTFTALMSQSLIARGLPVDSRMMLRLMPSYEAGMPFARRMSRGSLLRRSPLLWRRRRLPKIHKFSVAGIAATGAAVVAVAAPPRAVAPRTNGDATALGGGRGRPRWYGVPPPSPHTRVRGGHTGLRRMATIATSSSRAPPAWASRSWRMRWIRRCGSRSFQEARRSARG